MAVVFDPNPGATQRRRRTVVCPRLSVDGVSGWSAEDFKGLLSRPDYRMGAFVQLDLERTIRCLERPGNHPGPTYVADVCSSTWCRGCPFIGDPGETKSPGATIRRMRPAF